jgi:tetratricopeptide (TPR) repeat protein
VWAIIHFWPSTPYKPNETAKQWYDSGTDALRNGAYFAATKSLDQAINSDPKFALAHARLAEAFAELEYSERAKDELLTVSSLVSDRSRLPRVEAAYLEGVNATVSRDFAAAINAYQETVEQAPNDPQAYVDLGRAYQRNDQNDKALDNYLKAISLNGQYATAHLRAGIVYAANQNVPAASAAFEKALTLFTAGSNVEGQAQVYRQQGLLLRRSGKYPEAEAQFQKELDSSKTMANLSQQVTALLDLSGLSFSKGNTAEARDYANQAIELAQKSQLDSLVSLAQWNLGNSLYGRGNYAEAEKYFNQAIESARLGKNKFREETGSRDLGSVYIQQLRLDEGLALVEHARDFFEKGNYLKELSISLTAIGRARRHKGEFAEALKAFQQQLKIAQQAGDEPQVALSYADIGAVLYEQERYPEALENYDKAFSINKSIENRLQLAYGQHNRGDILWRLGRSPEADLALSDAFSIANDPARGFKALIPEIDRALAQQALSQRNFPEAKARATKALELAASEYKSVTIEAKSTLGLAQAQSGLAREGRVNCEEAAKMAVDAGDASLLSRTLLALAEAALNAGDAQTALDKASEAQSRFANGGQQESEWRALVLVALANQRLNQPDKAREKFAEAKAKLAQLQQKWGDDAFKQYLTRPDIQVHYKLLG